MDEKVREQILKLIAENNRLQETLHWHNYTSKGLSPELRRQATIYEGELYQQIAVIGQLVDQLRRGE